MDILEAILTRRSIRKFTGEVLNDDDLKTILKAGFYAPSAKNFQPWHFVIVKNSKTLEDISQIHPYAKMVPSAGCCIVVCGDKNDQNEEGFLIEDCSAAIENMLLAAHGIGLGAVWLSMYPISSRSEPIAELLSIPKNLITVGMIAVGYKSEEKTTDDRYKLEKIHFEKW
ncbi:MAG: nitroreductase family protein [Spirochaetes bacterium]|nr:nitroreductase family protein [Spirochaetota bacterium]